MTAVEVAIKNAVIAAGRLHGDLNTKERVIEGNGQVDVFGILARLDVPLLFRPLEGLLGAYLNDPAPGILVTTKRPLSVQRFTAAHELGHHYLRHNPSLDDESILRRSPFMASRDANLQEVEADSFAASFLLPQWLVVLHCKRQGWTTADFTSARVVYQLSLRAGTSYTATCWTLARYRFVNRLQARELSKIEPRTIKQSILGRFKPSNYYGDVWELTEADKSNVLHGGPSDIFVIRLKENAGAGYLWRVDELSQAGFSLRDDSRENASLSDTVGGPVTRRIVAESTRQQDGKLSLSEARPWQLDQVASRYIVDLDLYGAEAEGYSRAERRFRLEAA
ncbi:protease inhibitor I42 family protein [Prosthecomicrobium hirschii]|uniref:protease inhibitor I42 family protein n=1 Tax=Prosthecodimorpha hirschii TaxID=665126 RepID=UPI00221F5ABF|nr:protease inhibitor I42 family protein [Prosthecomicrobium hirschii]MCW1838751.1 protease inhibitor I42 family protein [Prosthecomicrobium hirschii]